MGIENVGVAPIYHRVPFVVRFWNEKASFEMSTGVDIRNWLPGKHTCTVGVTVPQNIPSGKYHVEIGMYDQNVDMIYLATDAERNGKFYRVGKLIVE